MQMARLDWSPPAQGADSKFLRGDGAWVSPPTPNKVTNASHADEVPWSGVSGKPSTFPPSGHTHDISDLTAGALPVSRGGTGATNATQARQHLEVPVSKLEFTASIDQILESGFYRVNEQADTPYQYSQMIVAHGGGDTVAQICIPYHSGHGNPKIRAGNPSSVGGLGSWDAWYDILTSAWPVSVAQGGTSSNTVAGARANLGIVRTTLYSGNLFSGSITLHDARNYRQLIVIGSPEAHASQMSQSVTTLDFTDSINMQLADNANWLGYKLTYSGDNLILTITSNANGGFITDVIGIG